MFPAKPTTLELQKCMDFRRVWVTRESTVLRRPFGTEPTNPEPALMIRGNRKPGPKPVHIFSVPDQSAQRTTVRTGAVI